MGMGPSDLGLKEGEEGAGALVTSVSKWKPHPDWQAGSRAEGRGSNLSSQPDKMG